MHNTDQKIEKFILVAAYDDDTRSGMPVESSLDELAELVRTSGGEAANRLTQKRDKPDAAHYLGKGKLLELKDLISLHGADGIVCDDELTSAQQKNLAEALDVKVMDRTMIILDIFAGRANTAEGKVQVELAQLKYNLSHLTGLGKQMSRLGGGIGTRGPGEKKLEMDRRRIKERITDLSRELKDIKTHRELLRKKRRKSAACVVSMVGYTNAGKSTLLNALTDAGVLSEDKLFATLDTTTRRMTLPGQSQILFTDTVGFIHKLPHNLIQAFRATLEELTDADFIVHVVDASSPAREAQMAVVYDTLRELSIQNKPIVTVFNKMDKDVEKPLPADRNAACTVPVSAAERTGLNEFKLALEAELQKLRQKTTFLVPYTDGKVLSALYGVCEILAESHEAEGTRVEAYASGDLRQKYARYIQD